MDNIDPNWAQFIFAIIFIATYLFIALLLYIAELRKRNRNKKG